MNKCVVQSGLFIIVAVFLSGCAPSGKEILVYDKGGIRFLHYSNWSITKDQVIDTKSGVRTITIEGPGNGLLSLITMPIDSSKTIEDFASSMAKTRARMAEDKLKLGPLKLAELSEGVSDKVSLRVSGKEAVAIRQKFKIIVLTEPVSHTALFTQASGKRIKVMIMCQAPDEDYEAVQPGIEKILDNLAIEN